MPPALLHARCTPPARLAPPARPSAGLRRSADSGEPPPPRSQARACGQRGLSQPRLGPAPGRPWASQPHHCRRHRYVWMELAGARAAMRPTVSASPKVTFCMDLEAGGAAGSDPQQLPSTAVHKVHQDEPRAGPGGMGSHACGLSRVTHRFRTTTTTAPSGRRKAVYSRSVFLDSLEATSPTRWEPSGMNLLHGHEQEATPERESELSRALLPPNLPCSPPDKLLLQPRSRSPGS